MPAGNRVSPLRIEAEVTGERMQNHRVRPQALPTGRAAATAPTHFGTPRAPATSATAAHAHESDGHLTAAIRVAAARA